MDQDSFRKLISAPSAASSSSNAHVRGSLLQAASSAKPKKKATDASQPAFKPRAVKKNAKADTYRDRATERRLGLDNEYAQVEALAEDFERRNADNEDRQAVEEQRKFLGGDSTHSVLVKGLDFALLEQNRARAAVADAVVDDASLEEAFRATGGQPKKRTREDIVRELKSKRGPADTAAEVSAADKALEEAKKAGKFRPIGFKPASGGTAKKKKRVKGAGEGEEGGEPKKKRKVVADAPTPTPTTATDPNTTSTSTNPPTAPAVPSKAAPPPAEPESEPVDEDFDIFADAGEYTGVDLGDDDSDDDARPTKPRDEGRPPEDEAPRPGRWFATEEDERQESPEKSLPPPQRTQSPDGRGEGSSRAPAEDAEDGEMEEEDVPVKLQPLQSSAIPSIREFLAMDQDADKAGKRRNRKEKKKAGGDAGAAGAGAGRNEAKDKAKVDRDYQRLKAFTDKTGKSGKK